MNILQKGSLDPQVRWLMAGMRLWHLVRREHPPQDDVDEIIENAKGRLGMIAVFAHKCGITITSEGFQVGERWFRQREQRFIACKVLLTHLKSEHARRLGERASSKSLCSPLRMGHPQKIWLQTTTPGETPKLGARLRDGMTTHASKKGSEKAVVRSEKSFAEGSSPGFLGVF